MSRLRTSIGSSKSIKTPTKVLDLDELEKFVQNNQTTPPSYKYDTKNTGQISDLFDKSILSQLEYQFSNSSTVKNSLSTEDFRILLSKYIPLYLVDNIYRSIDVNDTGYINYSDFTNYLISSEDGSTFSSKSYTSRLVQHIQQATNTSNHNIANIYHKDMIDCIIYITKPCSMLITGGRDGQLLLWNPSTLQLIAHINHSDKISVYNESLYNNMNKLLKAKCAKIAASNTSNKRKNTKVAITALCPVLTTGLLCVGSADACLTIYDIGTQDICGRYSDLDYIPTCITCFYHKRTTTSTTEALYNTPHSHNPDLPSLYIAIGDTNGNINIIILDAEFGLSTEVGMKKKNQLLFAQSIQEGCIKLRILPTWLTSMQFIPESDALVVSCTDGIIYFIDIIKGRIMKEFLLHQYNTNTSATGTTTSSNIATTTSSNIATTTGTTGTSSIGVTAFAYSNFCKYIASAAERSVLFWDLFTLEIIYKIENFKAIVIDIVVQDSIHKLFIGLSNKSIYVYHSITYEFIQVVYDTSVYKPQDLLTSMVFAWDLNVLYTAGNEINSFSLERAMESAETQQTEDLCCALYNSVFSQVILVKALGTVKIYEADSGELVREFSVLPINPLTNQPNKLTPDELTGQYTPVIKCACLDKMQARLIVTSYDHAVQLWNLNDGTPLYQLHPQLSSTSTSSCIEMTILQYEIIHINNKNTKERKKFLLVGTSVSSICGFLENNSAIEVNPSMQLSLSGTKATELSVCIDKRDTATSGSKMNLNRLVSGLVQNKRNSLNTMDNTSTSSDIHHMSSSNNKNTTSTSNNKISNSIDNMINTIILDKERINNPEEVQAHESIYMKMNPKEDTDSNNNNSTMGSVLWMELIESTSTLVVGYSDGTVALWNMHTLTRMHNLPFYQYGPVLPAMKTQDALKQGQKNHAKLSRFKRPLFGDHSLFHNSNNNMNIATTATTSSMHSIVPTAPITNTSITTTESTLPTAATVSATDPASITASADPSPVLTARKSLQANAEVGGGYSSGEEYSRGTPTSPALPKLNFSRRGETSPKLLTGSKTRKASVLKVSALKSSALRRASTLQARSSIQQSNSQLVNDIARLASSMGYNTTTSGSSHPRTISMDTVTTEGENDSESAFPIHSEVPTTMDTTTTIPNRESNDKNPESQNEIENKTQVSCEFTPVAPIAPPHTGVHRGGVTVGKHRDSAAVALTNNEMLRLKRSVGIKPGTAHRRLSVALQPYKPQHTQPLQQQPDEENTSMNTSMLSIDSATIHATPTSVLNLCNTSVINRPNPLQEDSLSRVDSGSSLEEMMSASLTLDSCTATADSSILYTQSTSIDQSTTAAGNNSAQEPEDVSTRIVVDTLIILPLTQVIIGACSDKYIRFWDLETHHILCSCLYYHVPENTTTDSSSTAGRSDHPTVPDHKAKHSHRHRSHSRSNPNSSTQFIPPSHATAHIPADEILRTLKVSDSEDMLIGAYDTGMLRTWSLHSYSIVTLKGLLKKYLSTISTTATANTSSDNMNATTSTIKKHSNIHYAGKIKPNTNADKDAKNPSSGLEGGGVYGFGAMAISPITLLQEWQAHASPFLSVEYVWFEPKPDNPTTSTTSASATTTASTSGEPREGEGTTASAQYAIHTHSRNNNNPAVRPSDTMENNPLPPLQAQIMRAKRIKHSDMGNMLLEGFIMSAGLDQRVFLWNLTGKCVGLFGAYGWEIGNETTWFKGIPSEIKERKEALKSRTVQYTGNYTHTQDQLHMNNVTEKTNFVRSPSTILIQDIGRQRFHTSKQLNNYVEALCRKIRNKPPRYVDENDYFTSIMAKHPIVKVGKLGRTQRK